MAQNQRTAALGREYIVGAQLPAEVQQRLRDAAAVLRHGVGQTQQFGNAVLAPGGGAYLVQQCAGHQCAAAAGQVPGAQVQGGRAVKAKGGVADRKVCALPQGGGSNSIGMFADFIDEPEVELIGVEAAGLGIETGKHASAMALGEPGVLHGMRSYLLQDTDGNIQLAHSISAGLDYPGVGPEHAYLRDTGRAKYVAITDVEAMDALMELCKLEGIIPAIESAHAIAYAFKKAKEMTMDQSMVICLSGRGDKDVNTIADYLDGKGYLN